MTHSFPIQEYPFLAVRANARLPERPPRLVGRSIRRLERFQTLTSSFRLIRQIGHWPGVRRGHRPEAVVVLVAYVRNLSVRGKILAGYVAILLMALALLGVAVALTSQTRDLLRTL